MNKFVTGDICLWESPKNTVFKGICEIMEVIPSKGPLVGEIIYEYRVKFKEDSGPGAIITVVNESELTLGIDSRFPTDKGAPKFETIESVLKNSKATDVQVGGNHYKDLKIQPIEYTMANNLNFCQGNIIKYVTRYKEKNGLEDLKKAKHYIDLLIQFEFGEKKMNVDYQKAEEMKEKLKTDSDFMGNLEEIGPLSLEELELHGRIYKIGIQLHDILGEILMLQTDGRMKSANPLILQQSATMALNAAQELFDISSKYKALTESLLFFAASARCVDLNKFQIEKGFVNYAKEKNMLRAKLIPNNGNGLI